MKKIIKPIATASVLALALTSATAELKIKNQARIRTSALSYSKPVEGDESTTLWNLKNSSAADYLDFYASNEYAGVTLESVIDAGNKAKTGAITFDTYYGWIIYGDLKFSFGDYDNRFTNRYNVTATEAGLLESDIAKYGVSNKLSYGLATDNSGKSSVSKSGKTWLYDFGNTAQIAGGENLALLADYTLDDVAGGKLVLTAGLLESEYDKTEKFNQQAGYVFEAAWKGESTSLDLIFKNPEKNAYGGAAYLSIKPADGINAVLGFTGGAQKDVIDLAYAVDGRFQYAADAIKATFVAKFSSIKPKGADKAETGLEFGTEVSYAVSDTIIAALDARLDYTDLDNNDKANLGENTVTISPRAKFSAGPAAAVTAALEFTQALNTSDDYKAATKTDVKIPVIFRVKL